MEQVVYEGARMPPQGKVSFEEFLEWLDEDTHAEWVDGEVILKTPVSVLHQDINSYLHALVSLWVAYHFQGSTYHPPLQVKFTLPSGKQVSREPDLVVILPGNSGQFQQHYFEGAPDLIVEILSPSNRNIDRLTKFEEYEAAGMPEYWLIDPDRQYAEFFQLDETGVYRVAFSGSEGVYRSRVLAGLWLEVRWLWERPPVWDVLRQWGLVG
ncbi:MAG: Uma2 family endonuclease [Fimbriimonadales bacterium]